MMTERGPLLEVIACSVSDAIEAEKGGAGRLEIIGEFERGGMTPPRELVRCVLDAVTVPVRVMLRESDGFGVTGEAEVERLCDAARELSQLSVDGVVLGFVHDRAIDLELTARVLSSAPDLKATFHHAFEEAGNHLEAINELKKLGQVDRILAHGGSGDWIEKGERLADYCRAAGPEIAILAGGGLNLASIESLLKTTPIREFHIGRAVRSPTPSAAVVEAGKVRELVQLIQAKTAV